jgi:predicted  nucleic acid-binding Zn-ribbon protein
VILLDWYRSHQRIPALAEDLDSAIKKAAEHQARAIEYERKFRNCHAQLADKQATIDHLRAEVVTAEAQLAAMDTSDTDTRRDTWRRWTAYQLRSLNEENDLLGHRVLALEAELAKRGTDRNEVYRAAGLPLVNPAETEGATP